MNRDPHSDSNQIFLDSSVAALIVIDGDIPYI